jgi:hypothetical protein
VQSTSQRVSSPINFRRCVRLTLVVVLVVVLALSLYHWIHPDILFLSGWRVYGGSMQFGHKWLFFFPFLFLLFFTGFVCRPCRKLNQPFNCFFLSIRSLLSYFYFFFLSNLFSNLVLILELLFFFVFNCFLDWFVFLTISP